MFVNKFLNREKKYEYLLYVFNDFDKKKKIKLFLKF